MYLERLVSPKLAALAAPACFVRRLLHPDLVSFGLMANVAALARQGLFADIDVVVDVGANIGQYAYMVHSVLPRVAIHSFEPDPECFRKLEKTFARFSIPGKCYRLALGDREGTSDFNLYDNSANNSMLVRHDDPSAGGRRVSVACSTLDLLQNEFTAFKRPMLKVDVQGFELAVLRGADRFLERCKYVQLEVSFRHAYHGSSHVADLFAVMRDKGFLGVEILDTLRMPREDGYGLREADLLFLNEALSG